MPPPAASPPIVGSGAMMLEIFTTGERSGSASVSIAIARPVASTASSGVPARSRATASHASEAS